VTTTLDRITINDFGNCRYSTFNFLYVKDAEGNCTGNILLMAGYKYKITFVCNQMLLHSADGTVQAKPPPRTYIYYSKDPDGNASSQASGTAVNCGFGSNCSVNDKFTTNKLDTDNATLHFKVNNVITLQEGEWCDFYGYFSVELD
jgi:hypothetical protein